MILYSSKIIRFIFEIKKMAVEILSQELGLKTGRDRFYDREKKYSYPIRIVMYNHQKMLGYFDPNFYELGFHECLMQTSRETLKNVIRHELAHYVVFIQEGGAVLPHGCEFKSFCKQAGWGDEVSRSTACLDGGRETLDGVEKSVLRKVQKLMALASSASSNESEQAMIKSRQLLLKNNLAFQEGGLEERFVLKRVLQRKKEDAKMRAIARILSTFFVSIVFRKGKGSICLEILGESANVEIGEYVADVLQKELDRLWETAKQNVSSQGMNAKNSFFLGVAKGYCQKVEVLQKEDGLNAAKALMVIEKKLAEAKRMAYSRLSSLAKGACPCPFSASLGEKMGRSLQIRPAVESAQEVLFIEF